MEKEMKEVGEKKNFNLSNFYTKMINDLQAPFQFPSAEKG